MTPVEQDTLRVALIKEPTSVPDLATTYTISLDCVRRWVNKQRAAGLVHVADYGHDSRGRRFVPLFKWGEGLDVARPGRCPVAAAAKQKRYRDRKTP